MQISIPNITGSTKQISWAKTIRSEKIDALLKLHTIINNQFVKNKDALVREIGRNEYNRQIQIITNTVQNFLNEKTSAKYWIEQHTSHATCEYFFQGAKTWYHNQVQNEIGNDQLLRSFQIIHNLK